MNLKKPLEIDIFESDDKQAELENLGIKASYSAQLIKCTLYSIDYINPYKPDWNDKPVSVIGSGGFEFISPLGYEEMKSLINKYIYP